MTARLVLVVVLCLDALAASAHITHASTLHLEVRGERLVGEWEITAVDARALLGVEVERKPDSLVADEIDELLALFASRVGISADGEPCAMSTPGGGTLVAGEPVTLRVGLEATCAGPMREVGLAYPLFLALDSDHRGYFSLRDGRHTQAGVFHHAQQSIALEVVHASGWLTLADSTRRAARTVVRRADLILSWLTLLLPVAAFRQAGRIGLRFLGAQLMGLAFWGFAPIDLSPRALGAAAAAALFAASWNNARPFLPRGARRQFFDVALVIGLGLTSGLALGAPLAAGGSFEQERALVFGGFAAGMVVVQGALAGLCTTPGIAFGRNPAYQRWFVPLASLAIAWFAALRFIERVANVRILTGL